MIGRGTAVGWVFTLAGEMALLLGLTSVQLGAAPEPTIKFLKPADGAALADDSALIEVSYTGSDEHPIVRVEVYVGGKRQFEYRPPKAEAQGRRSFTWELASIAAGEHRLRAQATDAAGRVASASVTVSVEAAQKRTPRQRWREELQRRLPEAQRRLEILRPYGEGQPPELLLEGGGLWSPVDPAIPRGAVRRYFRPDVQSQYWYPVLPARPIGRHPTRDEMRIVPDGEGGIIIPPNWQLQDVWPHVVPKGKGEYEFRLPDGRGRGTIRIVPPGGKEKKAPEEEPKKKDHGKGEP